MVRVSRPGIDVDTATSDQLLLDERVFQGQLYVAGYHPASNPNAVGFPSLGYTPHAMAFNLFSDGSVIYPSRYTYQTGGASFAYPTTAYAVGDGWIELYPGSAPSVIGMYYLIFRRPRG